MQFVGIPKALFRGQIHTYTWGKKCLKSMISCKKLKRIISKSEEGRKQKKNSWNNVIENKQ